jgi:hypothetical protein
LIWYKIEKSLIYFMKKWKKIICSKFLYLNSNKKNWCNIKSENYHLICNRTILDFNLMVILKTT